MKDRPEPRSGRFHGVLSGSSGSFVSFCQGSGRVPSNQHLLPLGSVSFAHRPSLSPFDRKRWRRPRCGPTASFGVVSVSHLAREGSENWKWNARKKTHPSGLVSFRESFPKPVGSPNAWKVRDFSAHDTLRSWKVPEVSYFNEVQGQNGIGPTQRRLPSEEFSSLSFSFFWGHDSVSGCFWGLSKSENVGVSL